MSRRALTAVVVAIAVATGAFAAWRGRAPHARLLFTGDILLARQVAVEERATGRSPFDSVAPLLRRADWVAGNLEGAIGPDSACVQHDRELCFAVDPSAAAIAARAGFAMLGVANNHAADLGDAGRDRTRASLADAGVLPVDFDHSPRFADLNGLTVGVVAIDLVPGVDGRAQQVPSVDVAQKLRLARALSNLVVVSIHWGKELHDWPDSAQRAAAAWLVDHGADLVVGHHPHVVEPPDCVHGRPVFYSLGNHVFDQKYAATKVGLIADCTVARGRLRCAGLRTRTRRGSAVPLPAGAYRIAALAECAVPTHDPIAIGEWTLRPAPWSRGDTASGIALEGWRGGVARWRTRPVALVSLDPALASGDGTPLLLALERHRSSMDGELALRPHVYALSDRGLTARWRGTALAWPLVDAEVDAEGDLCALHRGDSFLRIDPTTTARRTMRYRWNGFGFSGVPDEGGACARRYARGGG